ncbi:MAG: SPFH domain-containing protein [Clostridiales bacterium]
MKEMTKKTHRGLHFMIITFVLLIIDVFIFVKTVQTLETPILTNVVLFIFSIILFIVICIMFSGFFTLQPNEAAVLILFGEYKGTVKDDGWHFVNPFNTVKKISLRSRTFESEKIKVNDYMGNPIEIATIIIWKVENTAKAFFDVDNYDYYVRTQTESALRHLAGLYPYDSGEDENIITLRGSVDEVSAALKKELQEKLEKAGVLVTETRLSHLAYSPEIAAAMLQRQQAAAIIAARKKIVEGAVGMVDMALKKLSDQNVIELDEERKAAMVSNLLVVLCGERGTQPVINTGTLYS